MPKSPDETLFSLRPADESVPAVARSLEAIRAFEIAAIDRAAALRARHAEGLLTLPASALIELEGQARAEETAAVHAATLIEKLEAKYTGAIAQAAHADLAAERAEIEQRQMTFAADFHPRYADFLAFMIDQLEAGDQLRRDAAQHNHRAAAFMKKCSQVGVEVAPIEPLSGTPICKAYFERVVLPQPNLEQIHARWTPLAIAGAFWTAREPEGTPPAVYAEMNARFNEIGAQIRTSQTERSRMVQESRHKFEMQNRKASERDAATRMAEAADGGLVASGQGRHFLDRAAATAAAPQPQQGQHRVAMPPKPQRQQPANGVPPDSEAPPRERFGTAPTMAAPDSAG